MAMIIFEDCITCGDCAAECPNNAISEGVLVYVIDKDKCTECIGYFDSPLCVDICPAHCIEKDPGHAESKDQLMARHHSLSVN